MKVMVILTEDDTDDRHGEHKDHNAENEQDDDESHGDDYDGHAEHEDVHCYGDAKQQG